MSSFLQSHKHGVEKNHLARAVDELLKEAFSSGGIVKTIAVDVEEQRVVTAFLELSDNVEERDTSTPASLIKGLLETAAG